MLPTIAIAFGLSADAFAAALGRSAGAAPPRWPEVLRTALLFGSVETLAPLAGWAIGLAASSAVAAVDHWIAFTLLGGIGLHMICRSVGTPRPAAPRRPSRRSRWLVLVATALATSLDALAVGATLALVGSDIVVTAAAIGLVTFVMAAAGTLLGGAASRRLGRYAEAAGGIVLLAIGTGILIDHVGFGGQALAAAAAAVA